VYEGLTLKKITATVKQHVAGHCSSPLVCACVRAGDRKCI